MGVRSNAGVIEFQNNGGAWFVPSGGGATWEDEIFVVDSTIQSTGTITLLFTPSPKADFVFLNGLKLIRDPSYDYTISTNVITILNSSSVLVIGDLIQVQYSH